MRRHPFSTRLLREANAAPSPIQAAAVTALQLWALLDQARSQAAAERDDGLAFHLTLIDSALSLPERDEPASGTA